MKILKTLFGKKYVDKFRIIERRNESGDSLYYPEMLVGRKWESIDHYDEDLYTFVCWYKSFADAMEKINSIKLERIESDRVAKERDKAAYKTHTIHNVP